MTLISLKNCFVLVLVLLSSYTFYSCEKETLHSFNGKTMGTTYQVKFTSLKSKYISKESLKLEVDEYLIYINSLMSTYITNSEISKINASSELNWLKVTDELFYVLDASKVLTEQSNGAFDITVGPIVNLWGFGPRFGKSVPATKTIIESLKFVGMDKYLLNKKDKTLKKSHKNVYLDLSSIAKGYAVDKLSEILDKKNIKHYLVEIGGEIRVKGNKLGSPWKMAIERPYENNRKIDKIIKISDISVATSGDYRNYFKVGNKKYSHTINPKTGMPVKHQLASVTVFSKKSCMNADAYATTLMVLGKESGLKFAEKHKIAAYFIYYKDDEKKDSYDVIASSKLKKLFPEVF